LSPAGHQPMTSADGRYVIIFNGEIYSFQEIRADLEARGVKFRGHSDTEVILESISLFGLDATLKRMIGMFAIALWDRKDRTLSLIRDRLGIKPIYWAKFGSLFAFGSELKALREVPGWAPRIDREAVASYMRYGYIPAPRTIYEGVQKLEPGCVLTLPWGQEPGISRFWDAGAIARNGIANPLSGDDGALIDQLEALLQDAVKRRMVADVPLGAFLSGGVDSSTVVALMQSAGMGTVKTFSIGFDIPGFNEAPHAAAVARHLRTDHTELTVTAQQAMDVIPRLPDMYDEPFADSSQIPTYLLSAMTRKYVTVALSGDGGDELFAGYNRHHLTHRFGPLMAKVPVALRKAAAGLLAAASPDRWTSALSGIPGAPPQIGDKIHKAASVLATDDTAALYSQLVTHWDPRAVALSGDEIQPALSAEELAARIPDPVARMQFLDLTTYLPDDILTKVDRASMAVALEARVPLIDHRVVEFSWRLPRNTMIRDGVSKWILRQILYRHVPREIIERPKMGFGVPLGNWLRGPLRDWAENLLATDRLRKSGLLDAAKVRSCWDEHLAGRRNNEHLLWDVLMLETWLERWA
ncbi:MAG: asparagine synthase (glutamine-hydrolyzing), partial [Pseudolabrys sp.]|nr:asparagine synthase (glutamine-hydrolyzing) [Pseudolabrys sp.]